METLTREELKSLAAERNSLCVSLYRSLHRRYPHTAGNETALRDALDEAEAKLDLEGLESAEIERLLKPARELVRDPEFWQTTDARGIALFLSVNDEQQAPLKTVHLPFPVPDSVDVGQRFHVTPLVNLIDWDSRYYLLALGQHGVRLYACNHVQAELLTLPTGVPKSFEEFIAGTETQKPIQFRASAGTGAGSSQTGIIHGQTSHKDEHEMRVREFVSQVGKNMHHWLTGQNTPLVLAAVESYHPMFADACPYSQLVAQGVHGSPDGMDEGEMYERAMECVTEWRNARVGDFNGQYQSREAHGHATNLLEVVVPAASAGRIDSLLIASGVRAWGQYFPDEVGVVVHEDKSPGDVDLMDVAVSETLSHGGEVHTVDSPYLPGGAPAAAILRW